MNVRFYYYFTALTCPSFSSLHQCTRQQYLFSLDYEQNIRLHTHFCDFKFYFPFYNLTMSLHQKLNRNEIDMWCLYINGIVHKCCIYDVNIFFFFNNYAPTNVIPCTFQLYLGSFVAQSLFVYHFFHCQAIYVFRMYFGCLNSEFNHFKRVTQKIKDSIYMKFGIFLQIA